MYNLINERKANLSLNEVIEDEFNNSHENLKSLYDKYDKSVNPFANQNLNKISDFDNFFKHTDLEECSLDERIAEKIDALIAKRIRNEAAVSATRTATTSKRHFNENSNNHESNCDHYLPGNHYNLENKHDAIDLENLNASRKYAVNNIKHRPIRNELANNNELDCIFNQLSLLEKYLSRLEIRLISLESKLST